MLLLTPIIHNPEINQVLFYLILINSSCLLLVLPVKNAFADTIINQHEDQRFVNGGKESLSEAEKRGEIDIYKNCNHKIVYTSNQTSN